MRFAIIPAYNEEKNIGELVRRIRRLDNIKSIVIDDGSKDKTSYFAKKANAFVLRHERRKGKGEALNTGFNFLIKNHPEAKYVIVIDADMQYMPEEIPKILKPLETGKADFVSGYREFKNTPFRHRLGNFVWRTIFNIMFGTDFKDTNCGFMGMTADAMKTMKRINGGYIIENQIFIQALKNKLRIKQVLVKVIYKRKSKVVRGIRVVAGVLIFIIREGFKYRLGIKD